MMRNLVNMYFLPHIIRMVISRKMKLARHVAGMGEKRNAYTVLVVNLKERTTWKTQL
jgi:hypothetical protein